MKIISTRTVRSAIGALVCSFLLSISFAASAQVYTWTGMSSTLWGDPLNWDPLRVTSTSNDTLRFAQADSLTVTEIPSTTVRRIEVDNGARVALFNASGASSLTINSMHLANGQVHFRFAQAATLNVSGSLTAGNGTYFFRPTAALTLDFTGTNIREIATSVFGSASILTLGNAQLSLTGPLVSTGAFLMTGNGTITLNNHDLTIRGSYTGGSAFSYFITNGTGRLVQTVASNEQTFHVGRGGTYTPITLACANCAGVDEMRMHVGPLTATPAGGNQVNSLAVLRSWSFQLVGPANRTADVTLRYNEADKSGDLGNNDVIPLLRLASDTAWGNGSSVSVPLAFGAFNYTFPNATLATGTEYRAAFLGVGNEVLPVRWQSFTGEASGRTAHLRWQTTFEQNNAGFEVEKSTDGERFGAIGFVPGQGNASGLHDYVFEDMAFGGFAFYRLRQVDFDGQTDYSDVILIVAEHVQGTLTEATPYPVPFGDKLFVRLALAHPAQVDFQLIDPRGVIYARGQQWVAPGEPLQINTITLPRGLYWLQLRQGRELSAYRVTRF